MFKSANTGKYFTESRFITPPTLLYVSKVEKDEWSITRRLTHMHDHAEVGFVRSGSSVFIIGEEKYTVSRGDLYIYNRGVLHDEQPEKYNLSVYCAGISHLNLPQLPPDHILPDHISPIIHCAEHFKLLDQLYGCLYEYSEQTQSGESAVVSHILMTILSLIFQKAEQHQSHSSSLHSRRNQLCGQIKTFINENYLNDISLPIISEAVSISPYYMSRVFKKETGYSPMEYVERLRLGNAQVLLIHTDMPIIDIAHQTGYNYISTFNRAFSKLFGMAPKDFKKVYRT